MGWQLLAARAGPELRSRTSSKGAWHSGKASSAVAIQSGRIAATSDATTTHLLGAIVKARRSTETQDSRGRRRIKTTGPNRLTGASGATSLVSTATR
jgi:hypothetical protein